VNGSPESRQYSYNLSRSSTPKGPLCDATNTEKSPRRDGPSEVDSLSCKTTRTDDDAVEVRRSVVQSRPASTLKYRNLSGTECGRSYEPDAGAQSDC
jgi:hypothetical protein